MSLADEIQQIEDGIRSDGLSIDAVLSTAGVDRSTWTRWKNGTVRGARYDTMQRVRQAVSVMAANANSLPKGEAA